MPSHRIGSYLLRIGLVFALSYTSGNVKADETDLCEMWLSRAILTPETSLSEVQKFTESRVPPMPEAKTAAEWEAHANRMRQDVLDRVVFRGVAAQWRDAKTKVEWLETIEGGPGYRIRKLRYEALPGLWIPALLYEPEKLEGKVPVVMNVNGHDRNGKAADYKQIRCINQAKRGMLALNVEWIGMGQLHTPGFMHYRMNQLDLCGTSGIAPFFLSMKRGLDVLLAHEHADPERVAVAGLSGGGWQTIFISALDTRVTLSNPVAGYSSFRTRARFLSDLGDSEQTPVDLATAADYAQLTAMRAPRPTLLTFNAKDQCCFRADHALPPLLEAATPIYKLFGKEQNLRSHVNEVPGDHNFGLENREAFYRVLGDHFYANDASYDAHEIPSEKEVKSADQLLVSLPDDNPDFNDLARKLMQPLPRNGALPTEKGALPTWQSERRARLRETVQLKDYTVQAEAIGMESKNRAQATFWKLKFASDWTVPAVEITRGRVTGTSILIADAGRKSTAAEVERLLEAGQRVVAVDPFYFGESKIPQKDFLFALLVSAVGERPLGVQAGQLGAIARWLHTEHKNGPVSLVAIGPRTSTLALVAAALEEHAISRVELHGARGSLKQIIEDNTAVNETPEQFCFGLLEVADVLQLSALTAPRPVEFRAPSERVRQELAPLSVLYKTLEVDFEPLK